MHETRFKKSWMGRLPFRGLSIQQRLPLLICVLLLFIIITFSWASYISVKRAAINMGRERLRSLTGQLSTMFGQSSMAILTATRTAAGQPSIKKYLQSDRKDSGVESLQLLQKLQPDSTWVLCELLDANRDPVLRAAKTGPETTAMLDSLSSLSITHADSSATGKIYFIKDSMYYPIMAAVPGESKPLGYLVRWRLLRATSKAIAQFSQLIGTDATLYVGNKDGTLWTDMIKPVSMPPLETLQGNDFLTYPGSKGKSVMIAAQAVPNTHWKVMVEFSRQTILEAANRFLRRIIIIGGVLIIIGMIIAWLMSRNITGPLNKLTAAASALAAGDYSSSAEIDRGDELGKLARAFNTMTAEVHHAQQDLERKVQERTRQLETANQELEAFSYSVSHDLRAPLRAINGHAIFLKEDYGTNLDDEGNRVIGKIISNAKMMGQLIDDLILFSQMEAKGVWSQEIDMKSLVESCVSELLQHEPKDKYKVDIHNLATCHGDQNLIRQVWMNLISNALKYSAKELSPCVEIGYTENVSGFEYFIRDNGVGFDMRHAHKLFGVFQRLHSSRDFEGTGIGLAFVKRILNKHRGDIRAEASPGAGATFYFSLPKTNNHE